MMIVVYNDHKPKTPTSTRQMYKKGFKHWNDRGLLQASVLFNWFAIVWFIWSHRISDQTVLVFATACFYLHFPIHIGIDFKINLSPKYSQESVPLDCAPHLSPPLP